jgi:hypothetical protein
LGIAPASANIRKTDNFPFFSGRPMSGASEDAEILRWPLVGGSEVWFFRDADGTGWIADHAGRSESSFGYIGWAPTRQGAQRLALDWLRRHRLRLDRAPPSLILISPPPPPSDFDDEEF